MPQEVESFVIDPDAPLPDDVYGRLPSRAQVLGHAVSVDAARWQKELSARGLMAPVGKLHGAGLVQLTRGDVFSVADQVPSPESAIQLLWYSLAWGLGTRAPRLHARLDGVAEDEGKAADLLTEAWEVVRSGADAEKAYSVLTTDKGRGRIKWLGRAFSTKFLYFAQGSTAVPNSLILDEVVATNLRPTAWPSAPTTAWWPSTYGSYCLLMKNWAEKAELRSGNETSPDQIELAVFKS
ncbi:hypothetical protein [Arthrobacter sp. B3I9]|uniref:8-oxoguanine DNA glycosylase OGG fold protein n=1 Tax=Arthrobacter sp. B3I9 TaxID=3042270 RepID=UPI00358ECA3E